MLHIVSYRRPDYKYKNLHYRKILNYISTINTTSKENSFGKKKLFIRRMYYKLIIY